MTFNTGGGDFLSHKLTVERLSYISVPRPKFVDKNLVRKYSCIFSRKILGSKWIMFKPIMGNELDFISIGRISSDFG